MPPFVNRTDIRYGRLLAKYPIREKGKKIKWFCVCDCGNTTDVDSGHLHTGAIQSCGCIKSEMCVAKNSSHLMSQTAEYHIWSGMRERCYNPNKRMFKNYGGRGISVCDRWLHSFENFYVDMGNRPSTNHSIDRIDNDGNYTHENCKWSTRFEQADNTRLLKWFYARSPIGRWYKAKNCAAFARKHKIKSPSNISSVLHKKIPSHAGWSFYLLKVGSA